LVDRFGAHRLIIITTALFGCACFLFASASEVMMLKIARLIMGFAGSFAFISTFKLAMIWFPPSMLGLLAGITQCSGMLGAAFGEGPSAHVVTLIGWRGLLYLVGCIMFVLSIVSLLIMRPPNKNALAPLESWYDLWRGLIQVLKNPQSWLNAFFAGLIFMPTLAFGEAWGTPYLIQVKGFSLHEAGFADSVLFTGWVIGGVLVGSLSDYIQQRKPIFYFSAILSAIFMSLVIFIPNISFEFCSLCLFAYGLSNTGLITSYALSGEINAPGISGVSVSFCNLVSVLLGALWIPVIGYVFDMYGSKVIAGVHIYPMEAYQQVFLSFPFVLLFSALVALGIKETNCRNVTLHHE
jgi:MFS family permease